MKNFHLHRVLRLERRLEEIFAFFADPENLAVITPPHLFFRLLSSSTETIQEGTEIDYAMRLHGFPLRWRSRIIDWDPPNSFTDIQLRGPYSQWYHEHRFEETDGITTVTDHVKYSMIGGSIANVLLVRPDLERIFDYRNSELTRLFDRSRSVAAP